MADHITQKMSRDGNLIHWLTDGVIVIFCIVGFVFGKWPERLAMEPLVAFVLETGSPTQVSETALKYFGVIDDPASISELRATSESGRTRAIQVRRRDPATSMCFCWNRCPMVHRDTFI